MPKSWERSTGLAEDVVDGEFEHVEPVAPKALPKPKATKPRPGATLVEIAPEVEPKPVEVTPKSKASEDADDLPDGQWRDPQGLLRTRSGHRVGVTERERERPEDFGVFRADDTTASEEG